LEKTFQGSDKVEEADIAKAKAQFLYREGQNYAFMDMESYEQFSLSGETLGNAVNYLIEGTEVSVLNFNGSPVNIELPVKINLRVVEAPPGIKGNTVSTGGKNVKLETGLTLSAPLFVNEGDVIIVNTERGEYVSRV
jgi:elongation factor P